MNTAHPFAFLAAGAILAGCASHPYMTPSAACRSSPCDATVTVQSCGKIQVTPDPIVVANGNKPVMRWTLETSGWSFTDNGIDILKPGGQFDGKAKESARSFKWKNNNSMPGTYKYDVYVTDGSTTCRYDPTIVNQ